MRSRNISLVSPSNTNKVTVSNKLVTLRQGLSLYQKRIVMLAVSKLDSRNQIGFSDQIITAREYADLCGIDVRTAYKEITRAAHDLARSAVRAENPRTGKPIDVPWLKRVEYSDGAILLRFNDQMSEGLLQLKSLFTSYRLANVVTLKSVHAWRLYELLTRYRATGRARYTVTCLAEALDLTQSQRANFAETRRSIIEPAVHCLSRTDIKNTTMDTERAGRRIVAVIFRFTTSTHLSVNN